MRKNKTLRASFLGTNSTMDILEANYRTWCAQNGVVLDDGPSTTEGEDATDAMEIDVEEEAWNGFDDEEEDELPDFFKEQSAMKTKMASASGAKRKKRGKVREKVWELVRKVLEDDTKLGERRSRTCDEKDFLSLLWAFNQEGIHFS